MEQSTYTSKPNKKWKVIGIIFIVLTVIAMAGGTFFGIKFFDMRKDLDNRNAQIETLTTQITDLEKQLSAQQASGATDEEGYLVIKEWDIKAPLPAGLTDVYYQIEGDSAYIVARPATDASPYVLDVANNVKQYSLVALSRSSDSDQSHASAGTLVNSVHIGGYYFFVSGAQSYHGLFGTTDADHEMETRVQSMLVDMLKGIEAK